MFHNQQRWSLITRIKIHKQHFICIGSVFCLHVIWVGSQVYNEIVEDCEEEVEYPGPRCRRSKSVINFVFSTDTINVRGEEIETRKIMQCKHVLNWIHFSLPNFRENIHDFRSPCFFRMLASMILWRWTPLPSVTMFFYALKAKNSTRFARTGDLNAIPY